MNKVNFGRVLTAMVTPFDEKGAIDFHKTELLVEHLINNGSDGLVVAGTTGESPTLTKDEKLALFDTVVKTVNGRVPVIAGTGTNNTQASIELTQEAALLGINGVMAVAPYYNKPSQQGMIEHFKAIANATTLPVMLYNIPGRSVVNMSVDTIVELAKVKNIVCVKEASGDLEQMATIIDKTDTDFTLYSGDDSLTLPSMAIGGNGVISVASHIIGNEMQQIVQLFQAGSVNEAAKLHRKHLPLMKALFLTPNPTSVKMALQIKGINVGSVRLPLVPLTNAEKEILYQVMNS
ncbi:4-hydroxy-tetrahydrodipicolinate synthase [Alkalihalobacterium sp. APHAB7]|uniref:4-hydroxy-tetrahydrodipicolinate synthase n=1 Tax=Alkalihalobacterium sp. APHAB7 TaxID=3402081 RepID=UPI003AAE6A05